MILTICGIVLLVCGILFLLLPKKYLVNEKNIKPGQTIDQVAKNYRVLAIVFLFLGILFIVM